MKPEEIWNVRELSEARVGVLKRQIGGCQSDLKSAYPDPD